MSDATRAMQKGRRSRNRPRLPARTSPSSCATTRTCWASWACGSTPPTSSTSAPRPWPALAAAHKREASVRQAIEANARANFSAQAQTHAAVIDLLDARNHSDLARRVDEMSMLRFGLATGVIALEGPTRVPAGWHALAEGQVDMLAGEAPIARMGFFAPALPLFGDKAETIRSMALVRMAIWEPRREAVLAFGSTDPEASRRTWASSWSFLARVVERTAERWPCCDQRRRERPPGLRRLAGLPDAGAPGLAAHGAGLWRQRPGLSELPGAASRRGGQPVRHGRDLGRRPARLSGLPAAGRASPTTPWRRARSPRPVVDPRLPPLSRPAPRRGQRRRRPGARPAPENRPAASGLRGPGPRPDRRGRRGH
jgi:uncharacterized protein YigA (DUF484 family)